MSQGPGIEGGQLRLILQMSLSILVRAEKFHFIARARDCIGEDNLHFIVQV